MIHNAKKTEVIVLSDYFWTRRKPCFKIVLNSCACNFELEQILQTFTWFVSESC